MMMMTTPLLLFFCFLSTNVVVNAYTAESNLARMQKLTENGTNIIEFDTVKYRRFLDVSGSGHQRLFGTVAFFTARAHQFECRICAKIETQWRRAVTPVLSGYRQGYFDDVPPLFFILVDAEKAPEIFQAENVTSVPFVNYYAAGLSNPAALLEDRYTGLSEASHFLQYIEESHSIKFPKSADQPRAEKIGLVTGILAAFVVSVMTLRSDFGLGVLRNKHLWMTVSFGIYGFAVGGMVYCIIRTPPMLRYKTKSNFQIISSGGRDQLVMEGIIVGALYLVCSMSLIMLTRLAQATKNECASDQFLGSARKTVRSFVRFFLVAVYVTAFVYSGMLIYGLYTKKTQWYSWSSVTPEGVKYLLTGPTGASRSRSIFVSIVRRIVKVGAVWLYEFKGLSQFAIRAAKIMRLK